VKRVKFCLKTSASQPDVCFVENSWL